MENNNPNQMLLLPHYSLKKTVLQLWTVLEDPPRGLKSMVVHHLVQNRTRPKTGLDRTGLDRMNSVQSVVLGLALFGLWSGPDLDRAVRRTERWIRNPIKIKA